jgi:Fe2+ or Zn2+ uptake regulation protein
MQINEMRQFEVALKRYGLSVTKSRKTVFQLLLTASHPMTIQEIITGNTSSHFVSVYRTIDTLLQVGLIKQVPIGFKNRYEVSDEFKPHHHHVTCEQCGTSVAINDAAIEERMNQITQRSGMQPTKHHFEAYGICVKCSST